MDPKFTLHVPNEKPISLLKPKMPLKSSFPQLFSLRHSECVFPFISLKHTHTLQKTHTHTPKLAPRSPLESNVLLSRKPLIRPWLASI